VRVLAGCVSAGEGCDVGGESGASCRWGARSRLLAGWWLLSARLTPVGGVGLVMAGGRAVLRRRERAEAGEGAEEWLVPGPGSGEVQDGAAAGAGEASGDVQEAVAQAFGLASAKLVVQQQ
jgi:hypothetical protein